MTAGTARDLTEALLTAVLSTCFTNGADPKILSVSPTNKGVVSTFTGGGTRYVDTDDKKLVNSIDVYVGDFHTLKVVPSRQMANEIVLGLEDQVNFHFDDKVINIDKVTYSSNFYNTNEYLKNSKYKFNERIYFLRIKYCKFLSCRF